MTSSPSAAIDFDPVTMSIGGGAQQALEICASVPAGKRADTYVGTAALLANGEELFDELEVSVTVYCVPDMTIVDNAYNVLGNIMTLAPEPGGTAIGEFQLMNLGNCDLSYIDGASITGLPAGLTAWVEIDGDCPWNESIMGEVHVTWSDPQVPAGSYATTVTVTAEDDRYLVDNFALIVNIAELPSVAFLQESVDVIGVAGEIAETHATVWNTGQRGHRVRYHLHHRRPRRCDRLVHPGRERGLRSADGGDRRQRHLRLRPPHHRA